MQMKNQKNMPSRMKSFGGYMKWKKDSNYDKYSCQNETNEKNYFLVFSKIRKNGTIFIERILR